ncbi:4-hydroxy-tetrahydrodipicolinate synthase [Burkholderia pseudomallei]|uniref:4-hydroxy-tetrahydrodipicolinate synthase n=7 Tax=Pseudomonadota TaxID=1224 RepID=Q63Y42_BURPS|nr:dihydrodipicolinate synthase [Burkholderia pseudomallei 1710b]ANW51125.1 4-hydroxy-tetrahydrodipicolinate synthase [Burkholderia pseudomallei]EDO91334.1 dihydrodipicolinate synthase [Burkholderia pseudomallei Pasteur 52237]PNX05066.1 4-hydroxy-tetrahydrodipicolinate synthase [Burkholderia sp. 136(2017)]PNX16305.1 4-hydroxy-tetrahydrodipicolinate synthase [Burkholderia sp. 129]PNX31858.1 4-hydroxy-tetrahydrodipicolinate synthase [Burkholderia sp. 117]PNX40767.1 4-hydroxy-tetrahydrodipicolin
MHMQSRFEGIWLPIVTPFHARETGTVDHAALARLARHYSDEGIAGFVAGATTGEGALLNAGEQEAIFATLRDAAPARPIVLGITASATHAAAERARALAALRPDGLLVTPPVYVRPTQAGVQRHIEAVVEAADLPVLVYNIPYRTGVNVELDTLKALSRDARVAGVKECGGTMERMLRLVHETPLRILSGDDNQNFAALCAGAHGAIASAAHVLPAWHVRVYALLREGRLDDARRIAVALQPLVADLFAEPNPAPVKALLAAQGWCDNALRLPFLPVEEALATRLVAHWESLRQSEAAGA